jgi:hypothetical protein
MHDELNIYQEWALELILESKQKNFNQATESEISLAKKFDHGRSPALKMLGVHKIDEVLKLKESVAAALTFKCKEGTSYRQPTPEDYAFAELFIHSHQVSALKVLGLENYKDALNFTGTQSSALWIIYGDKYDWMSKPTTKEIDFAKKFTKNGQAEALEVFIKYNPEHALKFNNAVEAEALQNFCYIGEKDRKYREPTEDDIKLAQTFQVSPQVIALNHNLESHIARQFITWHQLSKLRAYESIDYKKALLDAQNEEQSYASATYDLAKYLHKESPQKLQFACSNPMLHSLKTCMDNYSLLDDFMNSDSDSDNEENDQEQEALMLIRAMDAVSYQHREYILNNRLDEHYIECTLVIGITKYCSSELEEEL